ncbi:MAG: SDR family oxidoreductase [Acidobacteriota bacterium]
MSEDEPHTGDAPILVTGCSSGIGLAVCERLLAASRPVFGVARSEPPSERDGLDFERCDLSDLEATLALGERLAKKPLAGAVLCAGAGRFGSLEEHSTHQIRRLIDLDLVSPMLLVRAILPSLKRRGEGRLVFLGSESARRAGAYGSVYSAAKFGLRGFAQSLRAESARSGIGVTIVNPGMVRTPFFDDLDFEPGEDGDQALVAADVAEVVLLALDARQGAVLDEIDLAPLKKVVRKKKSSSRKTK